ncbi:MAG: GAF domain-containing sensor histidine kinase [Cyanobacteria bacterium P01_A01_bin.83]
MVDSPIKAKKPSWNQGQILLETLASLSYREQDLDSYLYQITCAASHLLKVDWSVVTCCDHQEYQVIASNLKMQSQQNSFNLHGSLTGTVVKTGKSLCVRDTKLDNKYGIAPPGYRSYLGVPLKVPTGKIIGTVCCFGEKSQSFSAEALSITELLAERAAIAIDNYNLYQKQQDFNQALEKEVAKRTAQLQQAQAKLVETEKLAAIGQFASMIVHEIRNPTTTILMGLQSLQKLNLGQRNQMRLNLALEEGARLKRLLQEILLYAKPQILQAETIELNQLLADMSFSLRKMPEASQRKLQLVSDHSQFLVKGDRDKLKQVIINLVKNAFEATEAGETVTCHLSLDHNRAGCCVSVINQGTPIPPDILPKLMEPFVSNKPGGTGLGLAIVKQIVTNHGGALSIESDQVTGTRISFTLPQREPG